MPQVYLITGASTGFGALAARSLAKAGHTVFAGMYSHDGNTKTHEDDAAEFAKSNNAELRSVSLNLLDYDSVNAAVKHVHDTVGRLDAVVHNAGHMNWGPAESFTGEQYLRLYDVNVVGCQRLNQAVLPYMRKQRAGHLIWISSSSVYGGKSIMLAPYFAAKAAMDSLARRTSHFKDAAKPGVPTVAQEYEEGPMRGFSEQAQKGTLDVVPDDADPQMVADALVDLATKPRGEKPFRIFVDPVHDGCELVAPLIDRMGADFYRRFGLEKLLKVWL